MDTIHFDLILVGFGNVARRFVRLLAEQRDRLAAGYRMDWRVVGIATLRHGVVHAPDGLDVWRALEAVDSGHDLREVFREGATGPATALDLVRAAVPPARRLPARHPVVIETTVLDIRAGQPAISHVEAALTAGAHVVTANKGPAAFACRRLAGLARAAGCSFLFEGAVMDGTPVFNFARETLPAVRVVGFRGIVNSTTQHVLTAMEEGRGFEAALTEMQAQGIAEADASLDVDGWDAAAKTAALINALMDGEVTPHDIVRTGIAAVTGPEVRAARQRGERLRLVVSGRLEDGKPRGRVAPTRLPEGDMLAHLTGSQNALVLATDLLGEVAVVQLDSGLTQTAYALLSDLVTVRKTVAGSG